MRITEYNSEAEMGLAAANLFMNDLRQNPSLLLCAATGNSPLPLYTELIKEAANNANLFKHLRLIPLDEWIGLPNEKGSCHAFLNDNLIVPFSIAKEHYLKFDSKTGDLNQECLRIQGLLKTEGPIDLCVLGLGKNGHLGFNEPAEQLKPHCHIANLSHQSRQHAMLELLSQKPTQGITLGMQDILMAKHILIIISGTGKEDAKKAFFSGKVDPFCPATLLWQHDHVDCLVVK